MKTKIKQLLKATLYAIRHTIPAQLFLYKIIKDRPDLKKLIKAKGLVFLTEYTEGDAVKQTVVKGKYRLVLDNHVYLSGKSKGVTVAIRCLESNTCYKYASYRKESDTKTALDGIAEIYLVFEKFKEMTKEEKK